MEFYFFSCLTKIKTDTTLLCVHVVGVSIFLINLIPHHRRYVILDCLHGCDIIYGIVPYIILRKNPHTKGFRGIDSNIPYLPIITIRVFLPISNHSN